MNLKEAAYRIRPRRPKNLIYTSDGFRNDPQIQTTPLTRREQMLFPAILNAGLRHHIALVDKSAQWSIESLVSNAKGLHKPTDGDARRDSRKAKNPVLRQRKPFRTQSLAGYSLQVHGHQAMQKETFDSLRPNPLP